MKMKAMLAALCLPMTALAGGGVQGAEGKAVSAEAPTLVGPQKLVDTVNGVTFDLPAGWFATVPSPGAWGAMTVTGYDAGSVALWKSGRSSHSLTSDMVKFDVITFDMGGAATVADWVREYQARPNIDGMVLSTSETIAYRLAGRDGLAYVLHAGEHSPVVVALPWSKGKVALAVIAPANALDMDKALGILEGMRPADEVAAPAEASVDIRALAAPIRSLVDAELAKVGGSLSGLVGVTAACTSWTGTDNGACATGHSCAGNTPVTLYLPFQYLTYWQSGGSGSFFGNYYHGNCNNDYYAIDFNQFSNSTCTSYMNPTGQNVYAAAAGTASSGYEAGGYGNYVVVAHASNVRTRYAHLSQILISSGSVTTASVVGKVGESGSAAGAPHLHFGFQGKNTSGVYVSYCNRTGGCPNGEAARSPQSAKPSPMYTNTGSKSVTDYGCYQAPP
jgi:murein DD-endopeptidase MepM/ murein hydrolase activator NlpD